MIRDLTRFALPVLGGFLLFAVVLCAISIIQDFFFDRARFSAAVHESRMHTKEISEAAFDVLRRRSEHRGAEPSPVFNGHRAPPNTYCPIVDYVTDGHLRVPLVVTYAVKRRGAHSWESVLPGMHPVVPFVFPLAVVPVAGLEYGKGVVCYSDRSESEGYLPPISGPCFPQLTTEDGKLQGYVDIYFDQEDQRFPFAREVSAIRAQVLPPK